MNKFKDAFDSIQADEELKLKTKTYVFNELEKRQNKHFNSHKLISLACTILIFFSSAYWLFLIPTIEIDIDINPSIELKVNRFDKVIYAEGRNQDGIELLQGIDTRFVNYEDVVNQILNEEKILDLLNEDGMMTISVVGDNLSQSDRVMKDMEHHSQKHHNVECLSMEQADSDVAHNLGMSCGKYRQYQILSQYDSSITTEEVSQMSMREIKDLISDLSNKHPEVENDYSEGHHHGGHNGNRGHGRHQQNNCDKNGR